MWTLVEPDSTLDDKPGRQNARPGDTFASRLPDFDDGEMSVMSATPSRQRPLRRVFLYTTLSLILAAGLIAQVGYRHLDRISQHETVRPWLLTLCATAGCVLPTRQDSSLIVSNRLTMETHPDYQNVSRMALGFTNTADFPQPLPTIELVYSDIQGDEVAGRRFYPHHYQSDSAANAMPAGESLTAQIDFANPTADAVNYQVRFVYE